MSTGATAATDEQEEGLDFGGWTPTGRKTAGPDSELVELENPDGHKQTAIVYDKSWRGHERLTTGVELVQSFMEFPMVDGIACLTRAVHAQGLFQYETGSVLALIEVLRAYRDQRKPVGTRAALELCKAVAEMLQEASENGPMQGIYSHGGLTPWRIALDADGNVHLLGYGLPQMDMVALREDESLKVRDISYQYCPPERITSGYEDISSDLYALVLIAYEMITGEALIKGTSSTLKKAVEMGEAQTTLLGKKARSLGLPKDVFDAFAQALAFDPIGRFEHPWEFLQALGDAAESAKGETLAEVMATVRKTTRRGKALMDVGTAGGPNRSLALGGDRKTRMKSAAAARPVRGRGPAGRQNEQKVEGEGRWGKVRRGDDEEEESPTRTRRGRRGRGGEDEEETSSRVRRTRRGRGEDEEEEETSTRSRRTRRGSAGEDEDDSPRSRVRRSSRSTDETEAETDTVEETPAAEEPSEETPARATRSSRSRRSSRSSDDASEAAEVAEETDDKPAARASRSTRSSRSSRSTEATETAEEPVAEKPSRSRRSSRSSDKAEESTDANAEESTPEPEEETPRSRASRSTRSSRSTRGSSDEVEEEKPASRSTRSRRSSRSSKTEDAPEPEGDAAEDAPEDADKASRSTRSRRSSRSTSSDASTSSRSSRSTRSAAKGEDDDNDDGDAPKARSSRKRSSRKRSSKKK